MDARACLQLIVIYPTVASAFGIFSIGTAKTWMPVHAAFFMPSLARQTKNKHAVLLDPLQQVFFDTRDYYLIFLRSAALRRPRT